MRGVGGTTELCGGGEGVEGVSDETVGRGTDGVSPDSLISATCRQIQIWELAASRQEEIGARAFVFPDLKNTSVSTLLGGRSEAMSFGLSDDTQSKALGEAGS